MRNLPIKIGEKYEIKITRLGHSGEGIGKYKNFAIFVSGVLPGEVVNVIITKLNKNYARGSICKIIKFSYNRQKSACEIYDKCGGCQLQHLNYENQLIEKQQQIFDVIKRIAKINNVIIKKIIKAENSWFYRNKMKLSVGLNNNKFIIGHYISGSHVTINTNKCIIQNKINNIIIRVVKELITKLNIVPYNGQTTQNFLHYIVGRVGQTTGEVMVILITNSKTFLQMNNFLSELIKNIPGIVSIIQIINSNNKSNSLDGNLRVLWGKKWITEKIEKLKFFISAPSFFQVNTVQAIALYKQIKKYADLVGNETIFDVYCGIGTISLLLAQKAHKVYGIEIITEAIRDANRNAVFNNIKNVKFIEGNALQILPALFKNYEIPDIIVIDPPRAGCDKKILDIIVQIHPKKIIYVSCNPASLARDLAILYEKEYIPIEIQPVDMFPNTYHIETVCLILPK